MFAEDFCHSAAMSSEPRVYAARVLAAFEQAGLYTDDEIKAAGGPSSSTMTKIRKTAVGQGWITEPRGDTHRRIDRAARWPAGSSRELWRRGQDPGQPAPPIEEVTSTAEAVRQSNLSPTAKAAILRMLAEEEPPTPEPPTQQDVG